MMNDSQLGIIDWGIGGISIYKLIKSRCGGIPMYYFSDTGARPYGRMSREDLISRLDDVITFLRSRGVTHLVIGCNAASTVIPFLKTGEIKVRGVIESAIRCAAKAQPAELALIGGRRTVLSGIYRRAFAERGIKLTQRIAQPLSGLIESGDLSSPELHEQCRKIMTPIKNSSHLLLACTHYPAITPVIKKFVSETTTIIDPAGELIKEVKGWGLSDHGRDGFYTTGSPESMMKAAHKAFGVKISKVTRVTI
jgi:glutamate racemase